MATATTTPEKPKTDKPKAEKNKATKEPKPKKAPEPPPSVVVNGKLNDVNPFRQNSKRWWTVEILKRHKGKTLEEAMNDGDVDKHILASLPDDNKEKERKAYFKSIFTSEKWQRVHKLFTLSGGKIVYNAGKSEKDVDIVVTSRNAKTTNLDMSAANKPAKKPKKDKSAKKDSSK